MQKKNHPPSPAHTKGPRIVDAMRPILRDALLILFIYISDATLVYGERSIQFYTDSRCSMPVGNPVSIKDCQDGNSRFLGVKAVSFPNCSSSQAVLQISDTLSCDPPTFLPPVTTSKTGICLSLPIGLGIASVAFFCIARDQASHTSSIIETTALGTQIAANTAAAPTPTSDRSIPPPEPGDGYSINEKLGSVWVLGLGYRLSF
jgi:hypothetical protein